MIDAGRLGRLETALGRPLPASYRQFLEGHRWVSRDPEWVVRSDPDRWGLRGLFEVWEGPPYAQVDEAYRLTADVLPMGLLPIGDDSGGNMYLIDCRDNAGPVFWWDHESPASMTSLEPVAKTFLAFVADVGPEE